MQILSFPDLFLIVAMVLLSAANVMLSMSMYANLWIAAVIAVVQVAIAGWLLARVLSSKNT
ncbi:hypothetical protein CHL76_08720 [Marinococcus halophilus]|uniref:Uncharacterized protein n=1 Tax=Marinococcus halophilus TaxID=1371 RepID=A0A510Y689_MARHA|nr:hypothetical protein [Marinococcus halophilus]OZT80179.1 hypothetical protein CHL76_08720 [Marinococcus halophilus]GEK58231.1 hypothetical protein MHA01_11360 [Marinococcus halophilus]